MAKKYNVLSRSVMEDSASVFDQEGSPVRYRLLRRNMIIIMILVTILPLFMMALINHYQYQKALKREIIMPLRSIVNKTKHSFELFLK